MADTTRAGAMVASVQRAVHALGVAGEPLARLERAHRLAMAPRIEQLQDDHHPAYLHPGRSALILVRDVGVADVQLLSAAMLLESEDTSLRVELDRVVDECGPEVAETIGAVPPLGAADQVERLVVAPEPVRLVALAERLDHFRHLHMRGDTDVWAERLTEGERLWLPLAERTHEKLSTRYRHWYRVFGRRVQSAG